MAIVAPTQIGSYVGTTSVASHVLALSSGAAIGDLVVVIGGGSNGRTLSSCVDTRGNTWNLETTVSSTTLADLDVAWSVLTTALLATDTITFGLSGNSSFAMQAISCTLSAGWTWPAGTAARDSAAGSSGNSGGLTGTSSTAGPGATPAAADELFLDLTAIGGGFSAFTATGSYTSLGSVQSTGTIRGCGSTYFIATAAAAQTGVTNWTTARPWSARVLGFAPSTVATTPKSGVDSGALTDVSSVSATLPTTDTGTVTDGTPAIAAAVSVFDTAGMGEVASVSIISTLSINVQDGFQVGDYPASRAITDPAPVEAIPTPRKRYYLSGQGARNVTRRVR